MFTFQKISSKRRREDDSDSDDGGGHGYERQQLKKSRTLFSDPLTHHHTQNPSPQSLTLRPSLTPTRLVSEVEAIKPAQLDWEKTDCPIPSCEHAQSLQPNDLDTDMEDDHFDVQIQPPQSTQGFFMRPAMLDASLFGADAVNTNGRIPTPIYPAFQRSGMNGLGFPTSGAAGGLLNDDRSRRMPSPISEDEDMPDTPTALTQSQLSRLSFSQANPADCMDTETSPDSLALPPPTPRGRKRSGALTGMGRFSMGYREDCEKCRQRVPGHYSHFL